jgi:mannose-6-phosphate isomerase-like protein (cupin superfamily)
METFTDAASLEWMAVRPDVAQQVYGKSLLDEGTKMVLIRVAPGGGFAPHRDAYGHLFFFLAGEGVAGVGEVEVPAKPGLIVRIAAGEPHWYRNTGQEELTLISVNIP